MAKVKITADGVMSIIQSIFNDEDINVVIDDLAAPNWLGKTVQEALNVKYYTFKHRPVSSEQIIAEKIKEGADVSQLTALNRSFCLVSLGNIERLYSKDVDMSVLSVTMEYWIQTSKIQLLENLIEDCNISLTGLRVPVQFGDQMRQAVIIFSPVEITDVQVGTVCGEMAVCEVAVNILLYPDVVSYSDYTVEFSFVDNSGNSQSVMIPMSSFSYVTTMTQKAVPYLGNVRKVGNLNLSCANSFVLVFDGYNNDFVNYITDRALSTTADGQSSNNNQSFTMTVTRKGVDYTHTVVIKDHQVTVNADTGNETHTLSLVTRGM